MNITLEKPTTEWCRACGTEFHYSQHSMRCKCPECSEEKMSHGLKPIHSDVIRCYKYQGRFNLLSNELQWQYVFTNLPANVYKNGRKSFVIDDELDTEDPFDLADELQGIYEGYWVSSSKKDITDLVEFFTEDLRDEQYKKQQDNRKQELMAELYWICKSKTNND